MNGSVVTLVPTAAQQAMIDVWSPVVIALIPVIIMALKRVLPADLRDERFAKLLYPAVALALGPSLDLLMSKLVAHETGPHAALYGLLAIGLRELIDQGKKTVQTPSALKVLAAATLIGSLAGCATGANLPTNLPVHAGNPLTVLQKYTREDVQAALDLSKLSNDIVGQDCWGTLLVVMDQIGSNPLPQLKGIASTIQLKRNLMGQGAAPGQISGVKKAINRGCAALFVEEEVTIMKMGGAAALGIPALP